MREGVSIFLLVDSRRNVHTRAFASCYEVYCRFFALYEIVVAAVVITLTHRYSAVRGDRTGSITPITLERKLISGGKRIKTEDNTNNNRNKSYTSDKKKR